MTGVHTNRLLAPKILTALCGIGANLAGAYLYGLPGVVVANLVFSLLYCTWILLLWRDRNHRRCNPKHHLDR